MIQQYLTPEIIILAAAAACLSAVLVLVFASKHAMLRGLAAKLGVLEEQVTERKRLLEDIGTRTAEAAEIEKRVDHFQKRLTAIQQELAPLEGKHLKALSDYEDAKSKLRETREEWNQLKDRVDLYKDRVSKIDALEKEVGDLQKQRDNLEDLVKDLPKRQEELKKVEETLEQQKKAMAKQEKAMAEMNAEKESLAEKIAAGRKAVEECEEELRQRREEIEKLKNERIEVTTELRERRDKIRDIGWLPPKAFESLKKPVVDDYRGVRTPPSEQEALIRLHRQTQECGFDIPRRLQVAFHTSLKTSDISCLTVMAGVSGTGKSAFPKLYAKSMGLHYLPLAVEPRWDSPQDLFGFLNYMENRFEATTLGRALMQFDNSPHRQGDGHHDEMLMVLLDEMNLARIEYYFSEFLSKLETRRNADLNSPADFREVSVEVFAGQPAKDECPESPPVRIFAGSNILFVGTMNEDESTQSLSDKVIDRANVLHFGRPQEMDDKKQDVLRESDWLPLSFEAWREWIATDGADSIDYYPQVKSTLNRVNAVLADLGRPFGWRTFKAILSYIANHPEVLHANGQWQLPMADQIAMRIMPKLRGLDLREHATTFNLLEEELQKLGDDALRDAFRHGKKGTAGFFNWRGLTW